MGTRKAERSQGSIKRVHNSFDPADTHHARSTVRQIKYKLLHLSPKFPPLRSRVLGCRHAHRDGVSLFGRVPFLRSLIAAPIASLKLLFVRTGSLLFVLAFAQSARRAEIGSRWAAGPRVL